MAKPPFPVHEDRDDAVGDARAFRDRDGDRVRRRQDRAQRDAPGQGDRGDQPVDDEADREGGQEHEGNREHRDSLHLAPEVHGRHTHGRREQQRRQHHLEDDVRLDLDGPHLRQEPNRQADDQQDQGDATRTLCATNWHATMMSIPATAIRRGSTGQLYCEQPPQRRCHLTTPATRAANSRGAPRPTHLPAAPSPNVKQIQTSRTRSTINP